ncbi:MAG: orotidine-5'-phosphate decarboxylase [Gammaproteobacteria bacterium]|nr:orotidine-5'-phosphate decarboxylase [Gammaproteobacteria bacterium]
MSDPKVIVALDFPDIITATELVNKLDPSQCRLKVGKELFVRGGPQFVESVQGKGFDVFLDLKFHDIPNTVAAACRAATDLGVWMVNVHALGGLKMMQAAKDAIAGHNHKPLLIAVTILTSMDNDDLQGVGIAGEPAENVDRLAALAETAGIDGVVCSAQEAGRLSQSRKKDFILVTPGIRPANADVNDQKRIMTPQKAIQSGASYLVIGRPITQAADPLVALEQINRDLTS